MTSKFKCQDNQLDIFTLSYIFLWVYIWKRYTDQDFKVKEIPHFLLVIPAARLYR